MAAHENRAAIVIYIGAVIAVGLILAVEVRCGAEARLFEPGPSITSCNKSCARHSAIFARGW